MISEANEVGRGLYDYVNTPWGIINVKILLVFIVGEASRVISWELFGAIDAFLKDQYSKPAMRMSAFTGYVMNVYFSIKLAQIFKNGYTLDEALGWGIIYGAIAIVLHVSWVKIGYPIMKMKLNKKYKLEIK